jgi:hypothetical protein
VITAAQVLVGAGSATLLGVMPGGCQMALMVPSGSAYVGVGSASTSTGAPLASPYALLPGNPVTGSPVSVYATVAGGTIPVGVIVSTPR